MAPDDEGEEPAGAPAATAVLALVDTTGSAACAEALRGGLEALLEALPPGGLVRRKFQATAKHLFPFIPGLLMLRFVRFVLQFVAVSVPAFGFGLVAKQLRLWAPGWDRYRLRPPHWPRRRPRCCALRAPRQHMRPRRQVAPPALRERDQSTQVN